MSTFAVVNVDATKHATESCRVGLGGLALLGVALLARACVGCCGDQGGRPSNAKRVIYSAKVLSNGGS
jgi:hypothetical protein